MRLEILDRVIPILGITISKSAKILDFGCGAGGNVYKLLDRGYSGVAGYDVQDYVELRDPGDRSRFDISPRLDLRLPYEDDTFDVVLSDQVFEHVMDQVTVFRELHRITKPGGIGLHMIPARYMPIEGHTYVPFGGLFTHRWWYKLWAVLGIRNEFQKGLSADETADRNAFFAVEGLNYVPTSLYKVVWKRLGFEYKFVHQAFFDTHNRGLVRVVGNLNRVLPFIGWMYCLGRSRIVCLTKPDLKEV